MAGGIDSADGDAILRHCECGVVAAKGNRRQGDRLLRAIKLLDRAIDSVVGGDRDGRDPVLIRVEQVALVRNESKDTVGCAVIERHHPCAIGVLTGRAIAAAVTRIEQRRCVGAELDCATSGELIIDDEGWQKRDRAWCLHATFPAHEPRAADLRLLTCDVPDGTATDRDCGDRRGCDADVCLCEDTIGAQPRRAHVARDEQPIIRDPPCECVMAVDAATGDHGGVAGDIDDDERAWRVGHSGVVECCRNPRAVWRPEGCAPDGMWRGVMNVGERRGAHSMIQQPEIALIDECECGGRERLLATRRRAWCSDTGADREGTGHHDQPFVALSLGRVFRSNPLHSLCTKQERCQSRDSWVDALAYGAVDRIVALPPFVFSRQPESIVMPRPLSIRLLTW